MDRSSPPQVTVSPVYDPAPVRITLPGGAPLTLQERHDLPIVHLTVTFALPDAERDTLAALGAVWKPDVERLGARAEVTCERERCTVEVSAPSEVAAELPSRVWPRISARAVRAWQRWALEDWRSDVEYPWLVHEIAVCRALWPEGNPERRDRPEPHVTVREVRTLAERLQSAPMEVRVSGDTTTDAMMSGWGEHPAPRSERLPQLVIPEERRVFVAGEGEAHITVAWAVPGDAASELVFHALAGGFASRLNQRLRETEGLTYRVDGRWLPELGLARVDLVVGAADVDRARTVLEAELARRDFTADEVQAARWLIHGDTSNVLVDQANAAAAWLAGPRVWVVTGGPPREGAWDACFAVYGGECP